MSGQIRMWQTKPLWSRVTLGSLMLIVAALPSGRLLAAPPTVSVEIKSEHLTGLLPIGLLVDVNVKVTAEGSDASSLIGEGRHFASTGAHNYWPATGFTDGVVASLGGTSPIQMRRT
jgi:hypothetical protein